MPIVFIGGADKLCAFGFETAMAAVAALLRGFDREHARGAAAFPEPTPIVEASSDEATRLTRVSSGDTG